MLWLNGTMRLANDPRQHTTRTGNSMATGFALADVEGDERLGLALLAFGSIADELLRYRKGDSVRVSGVLRENKYNSREGVEVKQLQIQVDGIAGVRRASPVQRESKPRTAKANQDTADRQACTEPFDDEVGF